MTDPTPQDPAADRLLHVPALVHGRVLVRDPRRRASRHHLDAPTASLPIGDAAAPLLVACHGYGEDAAAVLTAVARIPGSEDWRLMAPQALHPFYTKTGDVVASWMTKLDREHAIADNTGYVGQAIAKLVRAHGRPSRLVFAGFSQGVAMTWRAAIRSGWHPDGVIALAGDVPPDVAPDIPADLAVLVGRGDADTWYTAEKLAADVATLTARRARFEPLTFTGGHVWGDDFLAAAGRFLDGLLV